MEKSGLVLSNQLISSLKIPKLILADDEKYLLVLEDCGSHMISLFDYVNIERVSSASEATEQIDLLVVRLHGFLNLLAEASTSVKRTDFYSQGTDQLLLDHFYSCYEQHVVDHFPVFQKYIPLVRKYTLQRQQHIALAKRSSELYIEDTKSYCLTFGDLWPNSLFFQSPCQMNSIVLIDFEFCGFAHPLADYFQLLAYLLILEFDSNSDRSKVLYMKQKWIDVIQSKQRGESIRGVIEIAEENLALLVTMVVGNLRDKRYSFTPDMETVCQSVVTAIDSLFLQYGFA